MAFSVIWATCSSTGRLLTQEIEPTEKTPPPRGVVEMDEMGTPVVGVQPLGQQPRVRGRTGRQLVRLMPGRPAGAAPVQRLLAEQVALLQAGPVEDPMAGVHDAVGGAGHRAGGREDDAEEVGLRLVTLAEAALRPDPRRRPAR